MGLIRAPRSSPASRPLRFAPSVAGSYTVLASFAGSTDYSSNSAIANFTIAQATPTVTVTDAGGTYKNAAFPATDSIKGVSGSAGSSLESVALVIGLLQRDIYECVAAHRPHTALRSADAAGAYTVVASFAGSTDYASTAQLADFTIAQATPTVTVADTGGTYNGTSFAATDSVKGVGGSARLDPRKHGPVVDYYSGTYSTASQLTGLTPLSAAPTRPARTPFSPPSPAAPTIRAPPSWRTSPSRRRRRR